MIPPEALPPAASEGEQQWRLARQLLAREDRDSAMPLLWRSAESGFLEAQFDLGRMLLYFPQDSAERSRGQQWLATAEARGHGGAAYLLAVLSLGERLESFDVDRMASRVLHAARCGYRLALRALALHWGRFGDAEQQRLSALCLEHAALAGDQVSMALLGVRLATGTLGCVHDPQRAQAIFALAHQAGLPVPAPAAGVNLDQAGPIELPALPDLLPLPDFAPAFAIRAPDLRCEKPWLAIIDEVLSAEECRFVILLGGGLVKPSTTASPDGELVHVDLRTSHEMVFEPDREDLSLRLIQRRMAASAGLPLANAEWLTLLRYTPGQEYREHRDYLPPSSIKPLAEGGPGQRLATAIAYLNPLPPGAHTVFPLLGLDLAPAPGSVLVFRNLDDDGLPDPQTLHAGRPVASGVKWICTLWLHQAAFRPV